MLSGIRNQGEIIGSFLDLLRCPQSGEILSVAGDCLVSENGAHSYRLNAAGIPLLGGGQLSPEAAAQQLHYDKIAAAYTANLKYPHTLEYFAYLDRATLGALTKPNLGTVIELCCGRGEAPALFGDRIRRYVGLDISENMLQVALREHALENGVFIQGDATRTPLAAESIDTVIMLGGVHHVPDRERLFAEVARILKTDGLFLYREPANDFLLWRAVRAIIYRLSPMLDSATERPLTYAQTVPLLEKVGLRSLCYQTHGLLGFCLFMNSDVLFVNRLFRFVPGIRAMTRGSARMDEILLRLPGMSRAGLQVVGLAQKQP